MWPKPNKLTKKVRNKSLLTFPLCSYKYIIIFRVLLSVPVLNPDFGEKQYFDLQDIYSSHRKGLKKKRTC